MPDIKIIIAAGSPVLRMRLAKAITGHGGIEVIAETADLPATYTRTEALEPQVILIARELTELAEFGQMKALFRALNTRWIALDSRGAPTPELPGDPAPLDINLPIADLCRQIAATALVEPAATPVAPLRLTARSGKLILIGASTGGVDALLAVLSAMPDDCPPIAVVQHTGRGFSESLIRLLARRCTVRVEPARDGMDLLPGSVAVAAGCPGHIRLRPGRPPRLTLTAGEAISGHMPSVDALFHSAVPLAPHIVATLLTGMGRDGAEGLLALRRAGAVTLGQNESSSVVYGMPRAAFELGAVQRQIALPDMAAAILQACAAAKGRVSP